MAAPWHRPLAGLIDDFSARSEDLRHILMTIDSVALEVPATWMDQDPEDGIARWGLPPDGHWRRGPDDVDARAVIAQEPEFGYPFCWKHTFYGAGAYEPFKRLAYQVVRSLSDIPAGDYERRRAALGLPLDAPQAARPSPQLWWIRAVHGIAARKHQGSDLWSTVGSVQADPRPTINSEGWRRAQAEGRPDVGRSDVSILEVDIFKASALALGHILAAFIPQEIVNVSPLLGGSPFCDVGGARWWRLREPILSEDQFPDRILKPCPPQFFPAVDRFAYCFVLETNGGRYLLLGALNDFWGQITPHGADSLWIIEGDQMRCHSRVGDNPVHLHYREIPKEEALKLLIASGHSSDLPGDLAALLKAELFSTSRPSQNPVVDVTPPEEGPPILPPHKAATDPDDRPHPIPTSPSEGRKGRLSKEPSRQDFAAYHLWILRIYDQRAIARMLEKEFKKPFDQPKVSRMVKRVRAWLVLGNVVPNLEPIPTPKTIPMDPKKLEQGPRNPKQSD